MPPPATVGDAVDSVFHGFVSDGAICTVSDGWNDERRPEGKGKDVGVKSLGPEIRRSMGYPATLVFYALIHHRRITLGSMYILSLPDPVTSQHPCGHWATVAPSRPL